MYAVLSTTLHSRSGYITWVNRLRAWRHAYFMLVLFAFGWSFDFGFYRSKDLCTV